VVDPDVDLSSQLIAMGAILGTKNVSGIFKKKKTISIPMRARAYTEPHCSVYSMAQASKAIIPKDVGGPFGQRIGVTVAGPLNSALRVGAYVTESVSSSNLSRYSIVVMNCKPAFLHLFFGFFLLKRP
jgi:hypothetical protein